MSEKIYIRLRTLFVTCLLLVIAVIVHAVSLKPRAWDCGSVEELIAGSQYVIEVCNIDGELGSRLNDARLRVSTVGGELLAQRHCHFEPWSQRNQFVIGESEIRYTDAAVEAGDGTFEIQTIAFPPARADWRAANFGRWFVDR
jgi:hypothetical protein